MPVYVVSKRNSVAEPGLTLDFIIPKPAFIEAHIQPGNFMSSVVDAAMDRLITAVHKPVMTGGVHLHKLTLARPFIARFMLLLFFSRPGPRRFDTGSREDLPYHMIRNHKSVINRKLLAKSSERRIRPVLLVEPDDLSTELVRVFLFLINEATMTIDKSGLTTRQIFVFKNKYRLRRKI